jgi:hypothetical protein
MYCGLWRIIMETKDKKCLEPKFESIPDELKELDQWVCWRIEKRNSKLTKVPYNPALMGLDLY